MAFDDFFEHTPHRLTIPRSFDDYRFRKQA